MKKVKQFAILEPQMVALLMGLAIGLALAVHEIFFLAALVLALIAGVRAIHEHLEGAKLTHRHL